MRRLSFEREVQSGFRVLGSERKQTDAERLAKEFGPNFTPVIFDVTDKAATSPD